MMGECGLIYGWRSETKSFYSPPITHDTDGISCFLSPLCTVYILLE
jgi:hypothetical protein